MHASATRPFDLARAVIALVTVAWCATSTGCAASAGGRRGDMAVVHTYIQASPWRPAQATAALYAQVDQLAGGTVLTPDPLLAVVAAEIARRVAADPQSRPPAAGVVQALAWLAGVTDPIPTVLTLRGRAGTSLTPLEAPLRSLLASDRPTHDGIARVSVGGDDVLVLALTQRRVRLEPVPREVSVGARVAVRGSLTAGLRAPALAITYPNGRTQETPLGDGPDFYGQFPVTTRGVHQVEITADSPAGSTVVANFPVYAEVSPPASPEDTVGTQSEDPATVRTTLVQLLNEARQRAHLEPLALLPALAAVAQAHSADMAEHHYVAHNGLDGTTPGDRLRQGGLQSGLLLENVGRGYSAREIHEGLMASPGHRANVLHSEATHVGVGVAQETGPGGGLLVTEDFIAVVPPLDLAAAPGTVLASVNQLRQRRGAVDLAVRAPLQAVAQAAAQSFFSPAHPSQEAVLNAATAQLGNEGLLFRRVVLSAALGNRLDVLDRLESVMDPELRAVGIGVAQGDRPDAPPRSIFVVYVLAVPRSAPTGN